MSLPLNGRQHAANSTESEVPLEPNGLECRHSCPPAAHGAVMILRMATPADVALLRHWDRQPHISAAKGDDDWAWEVELNKSPGWMEQLIADVEGRSIGFLQIIDPAREDSHYWGDVPPDLRAIDLWIGEPADVGKGYGTEMMRLALARCFADPAVTAVLVDPLAGNTRAHRFYKRLGFRFVEHRRFGRDDCFVYRLNRAEYISLTCGNRCSC